ncbi:hypothetical protein COW09_00410 [bacterium (Candidatus Moisslbacteria) CG12_big_fil_rev_8_21_14_0_65_36_11]|nr:MAG: hypothetical protein COW09_00410 [bacterium (Candidatus Moisslbacteria) CG12_big_fil_rev_8_21_14_0_65_36_11]
MAEIKRRRVAKIVLFIIVLLWLIISTTSIYLSTLRANNSEHFSQETAKMTRYVIEMAQEFAEMAQEWRGLAYQLNPEAAEAMEENIQKHYRNKMQQDQESKVWVKL